MISIIAVLHEKTHAEGSMKAIKEKIYPKYACHALRLIGTLYAMKK